MYIENMDSMSSLMSIKRHYKKDSRYVNDLYTLTYDNQESLYLSNEVISLQIEKARNDLEAENVSSVVLNFSKSIQNLNHLNFKIKPFEIKEQKRLTRFTFNHV